MPTFDLIALRETIAAQPLTALVQKNIYGVLMFGFGVLVSLFPLHSWAPLGYGAAPSSAAMLHAGVLKKFGLYGLIQIALPLIPSGAAHWSHILALLALGNVLIIGFVTIAQSDLKQMVGYSSVMHMGYAFLGIAAAAAATLAPDPGVRALAIGGVVLLMIAHGLSVALQFLLATSIHHRTQTFDMTEMGGLAKTAPVLATLFVAATFASIGLPGFGNFWGELTIFIALWNFSHWMTIAAVAGIIISAVYGLRAAARVFFGPPTAAFEKVAAARPPADLRWSEKVPALVLLAALVLLGVWPKLVSDPLNAQLTRMAPPANAPITNAPVGASLATPAVDGVQFIPSGIMPTPRRGNPMQPKATWQPLRGRSFVPRRGNPIQPRATPWVSNHQTSPALKGRPNRSRFETPFQGLAVFLSEYPGRCPGLHWGRPLAFQTDAIYIRTNCTLVDALTATGVASDAPAFLSNHQL